MLEAKIEHVLYESPGTDHGWQTAPSEFKRETS